MKRHSVENEPLMRINLKTRRNSKRLPYDHKTFFQTSLHRQEMLNTYSVAYLNDLVVLQCQSGPWEKKFQLPAFHLTDFVVRVKGVNNQTP
jgi:hypothetical protein